MAVETCLWYLHIVLNQVTVHSKQYLIIPFCVVPVAAVYVEGLTEGVCVCSFSLLHLQKQSCVLFCIFTHFIWEYKMS